MSSLNEFKKKKIIFLIPVIVGIISVSFLIAVEAQTKTFTFAADDEGFDAFTGNCGRGSYTNGHDSTDGNGDSGSLISDYNRPSGGSPANFVCNSFIDWEGTWEDLGVAPGDRANGIDGDFDYKADAGSVDTWGVGPLELRTSGCGTVTATLEARQGDFVTTQLTWVIVDNTGNVPFAAQVASSPICIRINTDLTTDSNSQDNEVNFDNIVLAISSESDPNAGIHIVTPGVISNGWIKLSDYKAENP